MKDLFLSLRPKQWVKNLFIFLPLIFGKKLFSFPENAASAAAFLIFSLAAGAIYLINDIIDIKKDRLHPAKSRRPLASGKVSVSSAKIAAVVLIIFSTAAAWALNVNFAKIILIYFIFNLLYSRTLKEVVIIDVFCVGGFFLLRVIAGAYIAGIEPSHWIVIMTVLLALFLGFNKRRQELELLKNEAPAHRDVLTKYNIYFIDQMIAVVTSSIVVVYMLYTVDAKTISLFGSRHLMFSIPFVYYGIFRYLYLIHKLHKDADPTQILLSDRNIQASVLLWVVICAAIIYFGA